VVTRYADPARIVQLADAHVGDGAAADEWRHVVDAVNALQPPADLVLFTGDGADEGYAWQRTGFLAELARIEAPVYAVTGNHDLDHGGTDGWLLEVGPELDYVARYGSLRLVGFSSGQDLDDGNHLGRLSEAGGPDASQLAWLAQALDGDAPTVVFFHHPLYNGLFGTVGPARETLLRLVTRDSVRAVMVAHVHHSEVYDRDGESRGLSTGSQVVSSWRWPLHYTCSRVTINGDGFALHQIGAEHVEYRWVGLSR
jgi:3',5'-cyclic AMP phosphodiesterase CpdA